MQRPIAIKPQEVAYRAAGGPAHCEEQNRSPFQSMDKQLAEVRRRADRGVWTASGQDFLRIKLPTSPRRASASFRIARHPPSPGALDI